MKTTHKTSGLTLVELLVALSVSAIVLSAVATLGYAFGRGYESMSDTSGAQARIRHATIWISDIVRYSRLVCYADSDCFALWRSDDNNDGKINIGELVYIDRSLDENSLTMWKLSGDANVALSAIGSVSTEWWTAKGGSATTLTILNQCSNVQFGYNATPPDSRLVTVSFELTDNSGTHEYEVSACLRASAANLLEGGVIVDDDD